MHRRNALFVTLVMLVLSIAASLILGSRSVSLSTVAQSFLAFDPSSNDHVIIRELRLPRTIMGVLVGMALGLAGALMQGLTRNPLADPGILGVNGGAALGVVFAISLLGLDAPATYVWFAFLGAAAASVAVFALASIGREGATPIKLTMAGVAIGAILTSITTAFLLLDSATFDTFRFWQVGALAGRSMQDVWSLAPFILAGTGVAVLVGPMLNTLALGDELAHGLGQNIALTRAAIALIIVILCGSATAAAGPIGFVGLAVPHLARFWGGADYRSVLPFSLVLAPTLLLSADVAGRFLSHPSEVQVGIVTVMLGAPIFIALIRKKRMDAI